MNGLLGGAERSTDVDPFENQTSLDIATAYLLSGGARALVNRTTGADIRVTLAKAGVLDCLDGDTRDLVEQGWTGEITLPETEYDSDKPSFGVMAEDEVWAFVRKHVNI